MPSNWLKSLLPLFLLVSVLLIPIIGILVNDNEKVNGNITEEVIDSEKNHNKTDSDNKPDKTKKDEEQTKQIVWGVDSATYTDQEFLACVKDNFGKPEIWGRYLGTKEGVSFGLDQEEVKLLHDDNIRILVIYNHFTDATSYDNGKNEAKNAIEMAKELDIPDGVAIFADIEPGYPVDNAFILGWMDQLLDSPYHPGIYGVFSEDQNLLGAFNKANKEKNDVKDKIIVWTAFPQEGITSKDKAPKKITGTAPDDSLIFGWQYGIDSETCNIDTNLFKSEILDYLW